MHRLVSSYTHAVKLDSCLRAARRGKIYPPSPLLPTRLMGTHIFPPAGEGAAPYQPINGDGR